MKLSKREVLAEIAHMPDCSYHGKNVELQLSGGTECFTDTAVRLFGVSAMDGGCVPAGEIHFLNQHGFTVAKIVNLKEEV